MCKVSDKIKFCTCSSEDIEIYELENYWVLHRLKTEGFDLLIGSFMLPNEDAENFEINKQTILKRLKDKDAFDIPISFNDDDNLVIYLNQNSGKEWEEIIYSFKFKLGEWEYEQYDPLELSGSYNKLKYGKIDSLYNEK